MMQREVFHVTALIHHGIVGWYLTTQLDLTNITDPYVKLAVGPLGWRFFSGWTFAIQVLFLTLAVLEDSLQVCQSIDMTKLRLRISEFNDYLFVTFLVPLTATTTFVFWTVYAWDREYLFPSTLDQLIGSWTNHAVHTVITPVMLLEMYLTKHFYRTSSLALRDIGLYLTIYDLVFFYTHFIEGIWLYPVYGILENWFQRLVFMAYGHITVVATYFLGKALNNAIWGETNKKQDIRGQQSQKLKNS